MGERSQRMKRRRSLRGSLKGLLKGEGGWNSKRERREEVGGIIMVVDVDTMMMRERIRMHHLVDEVIDVGVAVAGVVAVDPIVGVVVGVDTMILMEVVIMIGVVEDRTATEEVVEDHTTITKGEVGGTMTTSMLETDTTIEM
jgi:hypothetical protein